MSLNQIVDPDGFSTFVLMDSQGRPQTLTKCKDPAVSGANCPGDAQTITLQYEGSYLQEKDTDLENGASVITEKFAQDDLGRPTRYDKVWQQTELVSQQRTDSVVTSWSGQHSTEVHSSQFVGGTSNQVAPLPARVAPSHRHRLAGGTPCSWCAVRCPPRSRTTGSMTVPGKSPSPSRRAVCRRLRSTPTATSPRSPFAATTARRAPSSRMTSEAASPTRTRPMTVACTANMTAAAMCFSRPSARTQAALPHLSVRTPRSPWRIDMTLRATAR